MSFWEWKLDRNGKCYRQTKLRMEIEFFRTKIINLCRVDCGSGTSTLVSSDVQSANPPALKLYSSSVNVWRRKLRWNSAGTADRLHCRSRTISCGWCRRLQGGQKVFLSWQLLEPFAEDLLSDFPARSSWTESVGPADIMMAQQHLQILMPISHRRHRRDYAVSSCRLRRCKLS